LYFFFTDAFIGFLVYSGLLKGSYIASVPAIRILSLGYATLLIYAVSASTVIYSASRSRLWKIFGWTFVLGPVLGIFLNYLFVRRWGLLGIAYATDICLFLRAVIWTCFAWPLFRPARQALVRPLRPTAAVRLEKQPTMAEPSSGVVT
jgi:hypothetical protein